MTLEVPQNQISEELVQGQSKPQEILYEAIVNNLTRSESASRLVSCGVSQGLVLNPSHLKKKKKTQLRQNWQTYQMPAPH